MPMPPDTGCALAGAPLHPTIAYLSLRPLGPVRSGGDAYNRTIRTALAAAGRLCEVAIRPAPSPLPHGVRRGLALARAALSRRHDAKQCFQMPLRRPSDLRSRLGHVDAVVVSATDLMWAADALGNMPLLLVAHNIEHELYRSMVERLAPPLPALFARDLLRQQANERAAWRRVRGVICISERDAAVIRREAPGTPVLVVPPCFAGPLPVPAGRGGGERPLRLGLLGKMGWWPNRDGLEFLLQQVMPALSPARVELHVFGSGSEGVGATLPHVFGHGFVDDLADIWRTTDVMLCPIRQGSGVNVKLAEALFHGLPTLAHPYALRGLPLEPGPGLELAASAEDWVERLSADNLQVLAETPPTDAVRSLFQLEHHEPRISSFVADCLS